MLKPASKIIILCGSIFLIIFLLGEGLKIAMAYQNPGTAMPGSHRSPPFSGINTNRGPLLVDASWYSIESLKKEGTWKTSKGRMANGDKFNDNSFTCATRLYPLGYTLRVTAIRTGRSVIVRVTDRIGKRFSKTRVDLSKKAFSCLAELSRGIIQVRVEEVK